MAHDLAWFPVYATETLADERFQGWSCEERGAWFTLAALCWHEGSIPASHDQLRRYLHLDAPTFSLVWQAIGDRFAPSDEKPDRLVSPRMEKERVKAKRIVAERAKAGAKGGKAKAARALKAASNCQANAKQTSGVALANPAPAPTPSPAQETEAAALPVCLPTVGVHLQAECPNLAALVAAAAEAGVGIECGRLAPPWREAEALIRAAPPGAALAGVIRCAERRQGGKEHVPLAYVMGAMRDAVKGEAAPRGRQQPSQDFTQQPKW